MSRDLTTGTLMSKYTPTRVLPSKYIALLALALGGTVGCMDPTEVVVFADTTLGVPCEVDTLRIEIEGAGETETAEVPAGDGQASWTVTKGGGGDDFSVRVLALKEGAVVAEATADATFEDRVSREVVLVLDEECTTETCDLGTSTLSSLRGPDPATRAECVPEVNRYRFTDQSLLVNIIDACTFAAGTFQSFTGLSNTDAAVDDEALAAFLAEEFTFEFYGQVVNRLWVSDDGYISFGDSPEQATFNLVTNTEGITSAGHPENAVLAFWENLEFPANGELCAAVQSSGGIDTLWVTWKNACLGSACATGDRIEYSIGLEEGTNRIIVGFLTMVSATEPDRAAGGQAVVGLVGPNGTECDADECDAEGLCADGVTPCGFTQVFAREQQTGTWPSTFVFTPIVDE